MSARAELPPQRFRHWQGQMLRAADFRAQAEAAQSLARWHNRAIHDLFGIRFGLEVTVSSASPPGVEISCGIAFDCTGSMLILQRPRKLAVPQLPDGETLLLLVHDRQSKHACGSRELATPHPCGGGELWEQNLVFYWSPRQPGIPEGVPLAGVSLDENGVVALDASVRISARPLARPHFGSGSTIAGPTPWERWEYGVQTRIDTSAAGFTQIPRYAASFVTTAPVKTLDAPFYFTHIAGVEINEFTFRVLGPSLVIRQVSAINQSVVITDVPGGSPAAGSVVVTADEASAFQPGDRVIAIARDGGGSASDPIQVLGMERGRLRLSQRVEQLGPQARLVLAPLSRSQNRVRLADVKGLSAGDQVRLVTSEADDAAIQDAALATIERIDPKTNAVFLRFSPSFEGSFALEDLRLARLGSDGFQVAFMEAATRLGLIVCWMGCQETEFDPPVCQGQIPAPPTCEDSE